MATDWKESARDNLLALIRRLLSGARKGAGRLELSLFRGVKKQPESTRGAGSRSLGWGYTPVALVSVAGTAITFAAFIQSFEWGKSQVEIAFQEASQDRILVIQREIQQSIGVVQDIASFFDSSEVVGRREFRKFVGPALKHRAGIKALEWIPVVTAKERAAFIQRAQRSFPPFKITEPDADGRPIKSRERSVYYPVLYIRPYQKNRATLGLDKGTDPIAAELMQQAEATRALQVSPGILLGTENGERHGYMVAVPVFHRNEASGELQSAASAEIRGYAVGLFYVGEIVERALESLLSGGIDLRFYQGDSNHDKQHLYTHLSRLRVGRTPARGEQAEGFSYRQQIEVGNQQWTVVCSPIPEKFRSDYWNSLFVLAGGLAFTLLLTTYLATLVGRARQVRSEVEERTSQLRGVVQALNREVSERKSAEQELQRLNQTLEHHIAYLVLGKSPFLHIRYHIIVEVEETALRRMAQIQIRRVVLSSTKGGQGIGV